MRLRLLAVDHATLIEKLQGVFEALMVRLAGPIQNRPKWYVRWSTQCRCSSYKDTGYTNMPADCQIAWSIQLHNDSRTGRGPRTEGLYTIYSDDIQDANRGPQGPSDPPGEHYTIMCARRCDWNAPWRSEMELQRPEAWNSRTFWSGHYGSQPIALFCSLMRNAMQGDCCVVQGNVDIMFPRIFIYPWGIAYGELSL